MPCPGEGIIDEYGQSTIITADLKNISKPRLCLQRIYRLCDRRAAKSYQSHMVLIYADSEGHITCLTKLLDIIYQSYVVMDHVY